MEPIRRSCWIKPASIYVIPSREYVKIGIANDVQARWQQLKTGNPHIEWPHYVSVLVPNSQQIERIVHGTLARYRLPRTEWFRCSRYLAEVTVRLTIERFEK